MKRVLNLLWIGIVTGTIFGLLLKAMQALSGKEVYTLLLNVDYIPWFRDRVFHEVTEFSFHLVVSVVVVFVLYWIFKKMRLAHKLIPYMLTNGFIAAMLFTTTSFSSRTPDVLDTDAFGWWMLAHLIYGLLVGICIRIFVEKDVK